MVVKIWPSDERGWIEKMERHGWSLQRRQHLSRITSSEIRKPFWGEQHPFHQTAFVVEHETDEATELHFVRSLDLPHLSKIKRMEAELDSISLHLEGSRKREAEANEDISPWSAGCAGIVLLVIGSIVESVIKAKVPGHPAYALIAGWLFAIPAVLCFVAALGFLCLKVWHYFRPTVNKEIEADRARSASEWRRLEAEIEALVRDGGSL